MTQVLINDFNNNLQEVFEQAKTVSKSTSSVMSTIDNSTDDFHKIFNKQLSKESSTIDEIKNTSEKFSSNVAEDIKDSVEKLESTVENSFDKSGENQEAVPDAIKKTIDNAFSLIDMKTNGMKISLSEQLAEIRDLIEQVTNEANVENSLDLTLTKNIEDFIEQLNKYDKSKTEANIEDSEWSLKVEAETDADVNQNALMEVLDEIAVALKDDSTLDKDSKLSQIFEQILAYVDKNVKNTVSVTKSDEKMDLIETGSKLSDNESNLILDSVITQDESLEIFTNKIMQGADSSASSQKSSDQDFVVDEEMLKDLKIDSIEVETASADSGESLLQNQTPQEQGVRVMIDQQIEPFELKVDKTTNLQMASQQIQSKQIDINPGRIIEQITKQMELLQNNSKVSIVLNPESLGKVNIQLMSTKEGLTAQIMVTSQEAKDLLMKGLDGLKDSLLSHGVGVDNVSVKLNDVQKGAYNSDWTEQEGSRGGNKQQGNQSKEEKEKGLFEKMMAQTIKKEDGKV